MDSINIQDILDDHGIDSRRIDKWALWDKWQNRLLVGAIEQVIFRIDEGKKKLSLIVHTDGDKTVMVPHTQRLAYAFCRALGIDWDSTEEAHTFEPLLDQCLVIYYQGQDPEKGMQAPHMYNIHMLNSVSGEWPDFREELGKVRGVLSERLDLTPLVRNVPEPVGSSDDLDL